MKCEKCGGTRVVYGPRAHANGSEVKPCPVCSREWFEVSYVHFDGDEVWALAPGFYQSTFTSIHEARAEIARHIGGPDIALARVYAVTETSARIVAEVRKPEPAYPRNVCPVCGEPMLGVHYHEEDEQE